MKLPKKTTQTDKKNIDDNINLFHSTCFSCGQNILHGLHLNFQQDDKSVRCSMVITDSFQSYKGIVHGGIIATIIDAALVNCLHNIFKQDPFTGRLDVRFLHSIPTNVKIDIQAHFVSRRKNLCIGEAMLYRDNKLQVRAIGTFMLR